jgi:hypothetical protein
MQKHLVEQVKEVHVYRLPVCRIEPKEDAIRPRCFVSRSDLIAAVTSSKVMGYSKHSAAKGHLLYEALQPVGNIAIYVNRP